MVKKRKSHVRLHSRQKIFNMKKTLFILSLTILFFLSSHDVQALTPTPTKSGSTVSNTTTPATTPKSSPTSSTNPVGEKLDKQINELKEKIASRVSELKLVEKRAIIGTVTEVSANKVTLNDSEGDKRIIDVDEITKFTAPSKASFGLSDLTKGTKISVLGIYNKQSKRILARFIEQTVTPTYVSGAIVDIDSKNFQLVITTEDQKKIKIDIGSTTKILAYTKKDDLGKYGFTKLEIGDRVNVIGYPDKKDKNMVVADRIIDFLDLPKNPKVIVAKPSPTEAAEPVTSTGSGKKLTPIKK
jgi:hypothetical protein